MVSILLAFAFFVIFGLILCFAVRKWRYSRSPTRRSAEINPNICDSICFFICPKILCFRENDKRSDALTTRERIPLNMSKLVENPNYLTDNEKLLNSGISILVLIFVKLIEKLFLFLGIKHITKEKISFIQVLGEGAFGRGILFLII